MSNSTQANNNFLYDIIIVGGGMVGASMALAAAKDNFRVALIEAYPLDNEAQPSFDERTIALTYSSYQIYQSLGIWPTVAKNACAIKSIEVTNTNHWGFTHLDCQEVDTQALGYVIATRDLRQGFI
jgi:2-polyprenyl-6-methoxyphenol hydroxylase and related FAD-dependent oxidoreductases